MSKTIDFLLYIHTLPEDLAKVAETFDNVHWCTAQLYLKVIESKFLWKVWQIDEFGQLWIEVNSISKQGHPMFETLKIDKGTYNEVDTEPYQILSSE